MNNALTKLLPLAACLALPVSATTLSFSATGISGNSGDTTSITTIDTSSLIDITSVAFSASIDFGQDVFLDSGLGGGNSVGVQVNGNVIGRDSSSGATLFDFTFPNTILVRSESIQPGDNFFSFSTDFSDTESFTGFTADSIDISVNFDIEDRPDDSETTFTNTGYSGGDFDFQLTGTAVPEPSSALLLGVGALGLISRRKR